MPNAWPVQQVGSKGHDVRTVQYLLTHHGTPVGVDGVFGPGTKAAVEAFQTAKGLAADGIVGNPTWVALVVQVSSGSNGAAVSAAQGQLRSQGWRVPLDGAFGPATLRAVRDFQTARGLAVDGVVGQATWHALVAHFKHLSSPAASSTHLYDAWGADDRATALTNATLRRRRPPPPGPARHPDQRRLQPRPAARRGPLRLHVRVRGWRHQPRRPWQRHRRVLRGVGQVFRRLIRLRNVAGAARA